MKPAKRKTKSRRKAPARKREADRLERMYRELGFAYSDSVGDHSAQGFDFGLQRMDPRPRVNLSFSALSAP